MNYLMLTIGLVFSLETFAIPELDYVQNYTREILPLRAAFQHGSLMGSGDKSLHFITWRSKSSADRCLVILPGRSEPIEKYAEVVHSLNESPLKDQLTFFLLDHRGQGSSERFLAQTDKGHVDHFSRYALDLKRFFEQVVSQGNCRETYLLAHSMGAGIATDFIQKNPGLVDRAVLVSPMLKVLTRPYPYSVARAIVLGSMWLGRGSLFAVGQTPFDSESSFEDNLVTHSPARFRMSMDIYEELPQTKLGGVTNRWLNEIMRGTKRVRARYKSLKLPLRVFVASDEQYSEAGEMEKLCQRAPDCKVSKLNGKHELLMERDAVRDVVISEIAHFLQ